MEWYFELVEEFIAVLKLLQNLKRQRVIEISKMDIDAEKELARQIHEPVNMTFDLEVTHGPIRSLPGNRRLQAHVAPVSRGGDVLHVISSLQNESQWCDVTCWPSAFRVATFASNECFPDPSRSQLDEQSTNNPVVEEDCNDSDYVGGGEKLLHLLRRWDIYNVVVIVSVWDEGCSRFRKGPAGASFKVVIDCAKEVLEQCFYQATGSCVISVSADFASIYGSQRMSSSLDIRKKHPTDVKYQPSTISSIHSSSSYRAEHSGPEPHPSIQDDNNSNSRQVSRQVLHMQTCNVATGTLMVEETKGPPTRSWLEEHKQMRGTYAPGHFLADRENEIKMKGGNGSRLQGPKANTLLDDQGKRARKGRVFRVQSPAPELSIEDFHQLRALTKPPPVLAAVWEQVARLLGHPIEECDWIGLRPLFANPNKLRTQMQDFRVPVRELRRLHQWIGEFYVNNDTRNRILKASPIAWTIMEWLMSIVIEHQQRQTHKK